MYNMIDYIEVRNKNRNLIGIIDVAKSVIWRPTYYGVGDFEIYTQATEDVLNMLQVGNYVTIPNDDDVGLIDGIVIADDLQNGRMITATGSFAKVLLGRRHIYNLANANYSNIVTILKGNVEQAVRKVIRDNIINCTWNAQRNIDFLVLGAFSGSDKQIVDDEGNAAEKQVSYENLLSYTDDVLQEYNFGSRMLLDPNTLKLRYTVYEGKDRSVDNVDGNQPIIFSKKFENLATENYSFDTSTYRNMALIGGQGEGIERFYTIAGDNVSGANRYELFVDARQISKTYENEETGENAEYTDAEYAKILKSEGTQKLSEYAKVEEYTGEIDLSISPYQYGIDFELGDIVTVESTDLNIYINVRIVSITKVQDENGYTLSVEYENKGVDTWHSIADFIMLYYKMGIMIAHIMQMIIPSA